MYRVVERQRVVMGVGLIVHSGSGKEDESSSIPAPRDWEIRAIKAGKSCMPKVMSPKKSPKEGSCPNKRSDLTES